MTRYNSSFERTFPFSNITVQLALAAGTALTYTVPGDSSVTYRAQFSFPYDANVWCGYNVDATTPSAGTITSNSNIELIRFEDARYVRGGDTLNFLSVATVTDFGVALLKLP